MSTNSSDRQKRIVQHLDFGARTAKRVRWTEWEFTIGAPHQVRVTNTSYGTEKADHTYSVTVADHETADVVVPLHCDCPAAQYYDGDCKHQVAVAVCGGPVLLDAAMAYEADCDDATSTAEPQVLPDGGQPVAYESRERAVAPERDRELAQYMYAPTDDQDARADALGLTCPDWCEGADAEELSCFRCFFTADATDPAAPDR